MYSIYFPRDKNFGCFYWIRVSSSNSKITIKCWTIGTYLLNRYYKTVTYLVVRVRSTTVFEGAMQTGKADAASRLQISPRPWAHGK
jgi:hypothetical protein